MLLNLFQSAILVYLLQEITVHLAQNSERYDCFKTASVKLGNTQVKNFNLAQMKRRLG